MREALVQALPLRNRLGCCSSEILSLVGDSLHSEFKASLGSQTPGYINKQTINKWTNLGGGSNQERRGEGGKGKKSGNDGEEISPFVFLRVLS